MNSLISCQGSFMETSTTTVIDTKKKIVNTCTRRVKVGATFFFGGDVLGGECFHDTSMTTPPLPRTSTLSWYMVLVLTA